MVLARVNCTRDTGYYSLTSTLTYYTVQIAIQIFIIHNFPSSSVEALFARWWSCRNTILNTSCRNTIWSLFHFKFTKTVYSIQLVWRWGAMNKPNYKKMPCINFIKHSWQHQLPGQGLPHTLWNSNIGRKYRSISVRCYKWMKRSTISYVKLSYYCTVVR